MERNILFIGHILRKPETRLTKSRTTKKNRGKIYNSRTETASFLQIREKKDMIELNLIATDVKERTSVYKP